MTSLANGNLGMRGFFEEGYSGDTLPGIYIAAFIPDKTKAGWWKTAILGFGKVINAINFIKVGIKINGEVVDLPRTR
ncbi:hypothetical protein RYX41_18425 [Lactiplantibacillus plantarum]|nr:hypothetical protein [Lactiplantibacillus plantarum]